MENQAIGGFDTASTLVHVQRLAPHTAPDVLVIALGLANEGLPWTQGAASARALGESFAKGLRAIADAARQRWGPLKVVFGGVYPYLSCVEMVEF